MKATDPKFRAAAAFSLVEVALALGISAFCLVPLVALLPLGFNSNQAASSQTTATSIITHVLADLRATPAGPPPPSAQYSLPPGASATSAQYSIPIPAAGTSGATTLYFGNSLQQFSFAPQAGTSRYRLTTTFLPSTGRSATGVTLQVTWPATVDPVAAPNNLAGRVQVFGTLNRN